MADPAGELAHIAGVVRAVTHHLRIYHLNPRLEIENIMAALERLQALPARINAVAASLSTDTATAVAAAVAPLNEQIATLTASATQTETDTSSAADALEASVSNLETAAGVIPPPPPQ